MTPATPLRRVALFIVTVGILWLLAFGLSKVDWSAIKRFLFDFSALVEVIIVGALILAFVAAVLILIEWAWDGVYDSEEKR